MPKDDPMRGIVFAVCATILFATSDTIAKYLSESLPVVEFIWIRYVLFLVMALGLASRVRLRTLRPRAPKLQLLRGVCVVTSSVLFVYGVHSMSMAQATTISFLSPLLVTILSIPLLGEIVGIRRWAAVAAGLLGMLVVVRPGLGSFQAAALFGVASSVAWALALVITRRIAGTDTPQTTMLISSAVGSVVLSVLLPFEAIWPTPWQLTLYVLAGLATVGLWFWANMLYNRFTIGPGYWEYVYAGNWIFQLLFAVTVYGTVVGLSLTAQAWRRERDRDRREAELMLVAREAELGAIRAQFQPHFVLNALNSLLALIDKDPALARTMVVRLADVMKSVFDRMDVPAVPLERELDLVKAYLDVERIRFGARLSAAFEIEDAARGVLVPPFLLQPIVENAVKHGIAPNAAPGVVRVSAKVHNGRLDLEVRDSGTGAASPPGSGRGLALTRRRLETVYHDTYELTFDRQANGTSVRISMPTDAALHVA